MNSLEFRAVEIPSLETQTVKPKRKNPNNVTYDQDIIKTENKSRNPG